MYVIHQPELKVDGNEAVLRVSVDVDAVPRKLWFRFPAEFAPCLTADRCDAFAVMLLYHAMRGGHDIQSELPISARLRFQLSEIFFPALREYDPSLHAPALLCPTQTQAYPMGEEVGTGFSCGVDSMTALCSNSGENVVPGFSVTLPCHFSVGQFHAPDGCSYYAQRHDSARKNALAAAEELGLRLLYVDSNLAEQFPVKFIRVNTYANAAVTLLFQKLLRRYLMPSSYKVSEFGFHRFTDPSYFETFALSCLSTENTLLLSVNSEMSRLEKTALLQDVPAARRHLAPCGASKPGRLLNCGRCQKCLRTLGCLDALGKLDEFSEIFDVAEYRRNRARNIGFLLSVNGDDTNKGIVPALRRGPGIPAASYLWAVPYQIIRPVAQLVERRFSNTAKQRLRDVMAKRNIKTPY